MPTLTDYRTRELARTKASHNYQRPQRQRVEQHADLARWSLTFLIMLILGSVLGVMIIKVVAPALAQWLSQL